MLRNSSSWFIAIIVSSKSCVLIYGFPTIYLNSMLLSLNSSLITKPFQALYQTPLAAVNVLQRSNPLRYLLPSSTRLQSLNSTQNYTFESTGKNTQTTIRTNIQNISFNTSFPYDKQKNNTVEVYNTIITEATPISYIQGTETAKQVLLELSLQNVSTTNHFMHVIENLDRKFYQVSFNKFVSISSPDRRENGITFAQSGFFLYLEIIALCTESDAETVMEIQRSLELETSCAEQVPFIRDVLASLPKSSEFLKFRWSSRFVLGSQINVGEKLLENISPELQVNLDYVNNTDNPQQLTKNLNHMIDADSGWAMHDTFEEEELSNGVCTAWLMTMYLRARWRSAPTVLNGSRLFYDGDAPPRTVRMIRINDVMRFVRLDDWDAEAIEIGYAAPDLTLTILLPHGRSLRNLSERISAENIHNIHEKMKTKRIAVILPIYTLRMTLLLPGKLETMGLSRLVDSQVGAGCRSLKLSHSVQRLMFWAEAGRNAYKDDGIEWDEIPELERVVDRPYIFFVRWRNITLLNGNFVL